MKLLNCIISYNRYYYLKNVIDSLEEFFPYGDTILVDDQSDHVQALNYLDELRERGMPVFSTTIDKGSGLYKGGLYQAMDQGMAYARDHGYDYVNYLQDDIQCMWYDDKFQERLDRMFAYSESVLSVCPVFFKKIIKRWVGKNATLYPSIDGYDRKPLAIPAISIVSVERFAKLNFNFGDYQSERLFNEPLYQRGYFSLTPRLPLFAWIPWPKSTTHGVTTGIEKPPKRKYYYYPIQGSKLARYKSRSLTKLPFVEDYCQTWGYASMKPYWFQKFSARQYFNHLINNLKRGTLVIPYLSGKF